MVFDSIDRNGIGRVPKNEVAFYLIKLKAKIGQAIDLTRIANFHLFENDTTDISFESFTEYLEVIIV
jgi:hypothetical protein